MRRLRGAGRSLSAWGLAALLLVGGALSLRTGVRARNAYRLVASLELPPDGGERRSPRLRSGCDHRVAIAGMLGNRWNGTLYDAVEVFPPGGEPWAHSALELLPPDLAPDDTLLSRREAPLGGRGEAPAPPPGGSADASRRRVFRASPARDLAGEVVTARLDPQALAEEMYLPEGERSRTLEGSLRVEVWEHDRRGCARRGAGWSLLGVLLLGAGAVRSWRLRPRRRRLRRPARGSELELLMRRIGTARRDALAAAAAAPAGGALRERVNALHAAAWELAALAETHARAAGVQGRPIRGAHIGAGGAILAKVVGATRPGPEAEREGCPAGAPDLAALPRSVEASEAAQVRQDALCVYREHLAHLQQVEAVLLSLPVRLSAMVSSPASDAEALTTALRQELDATEQVVGLVRSIRARADR